MSFKKRTGFGKIVMPDLKTYQFNWSSNYDLVLYSEDGNKIVLNPFNSPFKEMPDSLEYQNSDPTWHGKRKTGPEFAGWGKKEARELFRKYLSIN